MNLPPLDVLLSYAFHAKTDLRRVRTAIGPQAVLMVDSGAFTAKSTGKPISLGAYAAFLEQHRGAWSAAVTLDVIGDHAATRANTRRLHGMGLPVMPVHTVGAPLADFDAAVRDTGYVAVGGMVGTAKNSQAAYLQVLTRRAREHGGNIHALGVARHSLLRQVQPYSSDVSTVSRSLLHGMIQLWDGRKAQLVGFGPSRPGEVQRHHALLRGYGLDVAALLRREVLGTAAGRTRVVEAALWGMRVQGTALRRGLQPVPVPPGVIGLPGPRLLIACVTSEITDAALNVATSTSPPRIVRTLLPKEPAA